MFSKIKLLLLNNRIIIENYFFMTLLQVLNSLFYLLIYPYLIHTLGAQNYGRYVFGMSIITYFISLVSFGFDFPGVKEIAQHPNDHKVKSNVLSCVFTAKIYLELLCMIIFITLITFIPNLRQYWGIYTILFANTFVNILFPTWYFQGIQKMRIVTYIQIAFKIFSLPLIFLFVNEANDISNFALIITVSNVSGALVAAYIISSYEKIKIEWIAFNDVRVWYKDALPFFWSTAGATIKQQSISIIIGTYFNMADVALYDLAYKIISVPLILFGSINGALFPKIAIDNRKSVIQRVVQFEVLAGFLVIGIIFFLGKWFVLLLGGFQMIGAYPIAIVMSFGILTLLVVGAYINFIFVPQKRYYLVTQNQIVAFCLFFILAAIGVLFWKNILAIAFAWTIAGLFEILYCKILIKKYKLF